MQRLDLTKGVPTEVVIRTLIQQLVNEKLIDDKIAPLISVAKIGRFFNDSPLGKQMIQHADSLRREVPFSLLLDAKRLYRAFDGDDKVLVHGIIDGYFQVDDEIWLFDYKTDHVSQQAATNILTKRYAGQLNIYAQALVAMGLPMPKRFIYAINAEKLIRLS